MHEVPRPRMMRVDRRRASSMGPNNRRGRRAQEIEIRDYTDLRTSIRALNIDENAHGFLFNFRFNWDDSVPKRRKIYEDLTANIGVFTSVVTTFISLFSVLL